MPRFIPDLPADFQFTVPIAVRITDLNYGGHVGNDRVLSIIHEARMLYLHHLGLSELKFGDAGLIMKTVTIDFVKELFWGDALQVSVKAGEYTRFGFSLYYKLEKMEADKPLIVATAKTGIVCFNYSTRKPGLLSEEIRERLV